MLKLTSSSSGLSFYRFECRTPLCLGLTEAVNMLTSTWLNWVITRIFIHSLVAGDLSCLRQLSTPPGAPVDVFVRGLSQSHTLLDSHLLLSSKPSPHLRCLECCRLVYVINDSFTASESQQTTPSVNYHPMSLLFMLKLCTGSTTATENQDLQDQAAFSSSLTVCTFIHAFLFVLLHRNLSYCLNSL